MKDETSMRMVSLTAKECEILLAAGKGFTSKEVADILNISAETVKSHKKSLMRKLGAVNIVNAVAIAYELGIWQRLYN